MPGEEPWKPENAPGFPSCGVNLANLSQPLMVPFKPKALDRQVVDAPLTRSGSRQTPLGADLSAAPGNVLQASFGHSSPESLKLLSLVFGQNQFSCKN